MSLARSIKQGKRCDVYFQIVLRTAISQVICHCCVRVLRYGFRHMGTVLLEWNRGQSSQPVRPSKSPFDVDLTSRSFIWRRSSIKKETSRLASSNSSVSSLENFPGIEH